MQCSNIAECSVKVKECSLRFQNVQTFQTLRNVQLQSVQTFNNVQTFRSIWNVQLENVHTECLVPVLKRWLQYNRYGML